MKLQAAPAYDRLDKYSLEKCILKNIHIMKTYVCIEKIYVGKTKICSWPYFRNYEVLDHGLLTKFDHNTLIYRLAE